jgi:hypothetical protein
VALEWEQGCYFNGRWQNVEVSRGCRGESEWLARGPLPFAT